MLVPLPPHLDSFSFILAILLSVLTSAGRIITHVYLDLVKEEAWRAGMGGCISLCFATMAAEPLASALFGGV